MPRKRRNSDEIRNQPPDVGNDGSGHRKDGSKLTRDEIRMLILEYICQGKMAVEVVDIMKEDHGIVITREKPYQVLAWAAARGMIRLVPDLHHRLADQVKEAYPRTLRAVEVVKATDFSGVAFHAARVLVDLVSQHHRPPFNREEVHIGFAGGHSMRNLAQAFARALSESKVEPQGKIVLHSLATGFDPHDTTTEPNAFFSHFVANPILESRVRMVGLHSMPLVTPREYEDLHMRQGVREAFETASEVDIVVTSASLWDCEDSQLYKFMQESPASLEVLRREGVVGDMLWRPIGIRGPIEVETEKRAMTVFDLSQLPGLIRRGKHVLLVLGPCGGCHGDKGRILRTILEPPDPLVTHLVADMRTVWEMLALRDSLAA